jgi:hypothetical protein
MEENKRKERMERWMAVSRIMATIEFYAESFWDFHPPTSTLAFSSCHFNVGNPLVKLKILLCFCQSFFDTYWDHHFVSVSKKLGQKQRSILSFTSGLPTSKPQEENASVLVGVQSLSGECWVLMPMLIMLLLLLLLLLLTMLKRFREKIQKNSTESRKRSKYSSITAEIIARPNRDRRRCRLFLTRQNKKVLILGMVYSECRTCQNTARSIEIAFACAAGESSMSWTTNTA